MIKALFNKQPEHSVILWGVGLSPYVRKVQIALAEKKLDYEHREILPKSLLLATGKPVPVEFEKASPLGKIPALRVNGVDLADSAVICAFLDKKYSSGRKLFPTDPYLYARAVWFENYADNIFSKVAYQNIFLESVVKPLVLGVTPKTEIIERAKLIELPPYLDYLEQEITKFEWIAGNEFSVADIALVTHFISLSQAGYSMDKMRWPHLGDYLEKSLSRDSIKKFS